MTLNTGTTQTFFDRFITNPLGTAGRGLAAGALGLSLLAGGAAEAQTPLLVGYQGAIFDASGQPVQGSADVDVAIFDASNGGSQLYAESHNGVSLVDGTFDVQIGSGTSPAGTFDENTFFGRGGVARADGGRRDADAAPAAGRRPVCAPRQGGGEPGRQHWDRPACADRGHPHGNDRGRHEPQW
jgi:hypothetical protein